MLKRRIIFALQRKSHAPRRFISQELRPETQFFLQYAITPYAHRTRARHNQWINHGGIFTRSHFSTAVPAIIFAPTVFAGLMLVLWTYKCFMLVLFQNKIIYMPSVPPFSRRERLADYEEICKPIVWEEKHIQSFDGTDLALCIGSIRTKNRIVLKAPHKHVVIIYFQGYEAVFPFLSGLLKNLPLGMPHLYLLERRNSPAF